MPNNLTLIHLLSAQPMPNLLPMLALKPARVIQICSDHERFRQGAQHLEAAAGELGLNCEFIRENLPSTSPNPTEIRTATAKYLERFPGAILNITGGTKLMSLGAYLAVENQAVLYCDTQSKSIQSLGAQPLPESTQSFEQVSEMLTLRAVMAAHGKSPKDWRFDTAKPKQLAFGTTAWQLRTAHAESFNQCQFSKHIRNFFRSDRGKIPGSADKLKALVAADICSAIPGDIPPAVRDYLRAAATAGYLLEEPNGAFHLSPGPDNRKKLRSHVESIANLLDGSWLELAVLSFIGSNSPRHLDPHWSVEPTGATESEYGETDLVVIDSHRAALQVISCKTSLSQPLEHLEGLRTRADNLGGSHSIPTLAILKANDEKQLRQWGKLLRVKILIGPEIPDYFQS